MGRGKAKNNGEKIERKKTIKIKNSRQRHGKKGE